MSSEAQIYPRGLVIALASAVLVTVVAWSKVLFTPGLIMHGDLAFPIHLINQIYNYYPMWSQHPSMSNLDEIDRLAVMLPSLWLFKVIHLSVDIYSRTLPFATSLFGAIGIIVAKRKLESRFFPELDSPVWIRVCTDLIACTVFTLNPWILYHVEAPLYQLAYAALPLFIAYQIDYLFSGSLLKLIVAAVLWTIASGSPQYTVFVTALSLAVALLAHRYGAQSRWFIIASRYATLTGLYALLNLYWIGPFFDIIRVEALNPGYTLRWSDVQTFSSNSSFLNVIAGTDDWVVWWKEFNPLAHGLLNAAAAVARPMLFVGVVALALKYWKAALMRFALIALPMLIVLLEGAHGPFGWVYRFVIIHFVGGFGWLIRAPEKFGAFLWTLYALITGIGLHKLGGEVIPVRAMIIYSISTFLILLGFLPIMYGTLYVHYVPIKVPSAYYSLWSHLQHADGKILVLADYEDLGRYNSGDAVFSWAPQNMAGSMVPRSMPLATFGVYHFTNPFSYFYSFIKAAGPKRLPVYASLLGVQFVLIERDVLGDDRWYEKWKHGLLSQRATLMEESNEFALFRIKTLPSYETKSGPYAVLVGDADSLNVLVDKFGSQIGPRNLFALEQVPTGSPRIAENASILILNHRTIADAAAESFPLKDYVAFAPKTTNEDITQDWAFFNLANQFEENGSFWRTWQTQVLGLPDTWSQDLGLGIVSTTRANSKIEIDKTVGPDVDVYVRYFDFSGPLRPAFEVFLNGRAQMVKGDSTYPVWRWISVGEIKGENRVRLVVVSKTGCPALNAVLIAPHGALGSVRSALLRRLHGRIVDIRSLSSLKKWPTALLDAGPSLPHRTILAKGSIVLDESYDRLWRARNASGVEYSVPSWFFANGFAPIFGPTIVEYALQVSLLNWTRIELVFLCVFGVTAAAVRACARL